jgi:hypothetical protein
MIVAPAFAVALFPPAAHIAMTDWLDRLNVQCTPNPPLPVRLAQQLLQDWADLDSDFARMRARELIAPLDVSVRQQLLEATLDYWMRDPLGEELVDVSALGVIYDSDGDPITSCALSVSCVRTQLVARLLVRLRTRLTDPTPSPMPAAVAQSKVLTADERRARRRRRRDGVPLAPQPKPLSFPPSNYYAQQHWHRHAADVRREWRYMCALNKVVRSKYITGRTASRTRRAADCVPLAKRVTKACATNCRSSARSTSRKLRNRTKGHPMTNDEPRRDRESRCTR